VARWTWYYEWRQESKAFQRTEAAHWYYNDNLLLFQCIDYLARRLHRARTMIVYKLSIIRGCNKIYQVEKGGFLERMKEDAILILTDRGLTDNKGTRKGFIDERIGKCYCSDI